MGESFFRIASKEAETELRDSNPEIRNVKHETWNLCLHLTNCNFPTRLHQRELIATVGGQGGDN